MLKASILGWLALVCAPACSSKSTSVPPDTSTDSASHDASTGVYDFNCGTGSACSLDTVCCSTPGPPLTVACSSEASCPAGDKITCAGQNDCAGTSTPVCCGVDVPDGTGTAPQCGIASVGATCTTATACHTHLANNCTDSSKVQLCHTPADCTETLNNHCCTFTSGAASLTFCIDAATASAGGGVCQ